MQGRKISITSFIFKQTQQILEVNWTRTYKTITWEMYSAGTKGQTLCDGCIPCLKLTNHAQMNSQAKTLWTKFPISDPKWWLTPPEIYQRKRQKDKLLSKILRAIIHNSHDCVTSQMTASTSPGQIILKGFHFRNTN